MSQLIEASLHRKHTAPITPMFFLNDKIFITAVCRFLLCFNHVFTRLDPEYQPSPRAMYSANEPFEMVCDPLRYQYAKLTAH